MNYYYQVGAKAHGPFNLIEMELLTRTRVVSAQTMVAVEGSPEWLPAVSYGDLSSLLPQMKLSEKRETTSAVAFAAIVIVGLFAVGFGNLGDQNSVGMIWLAFAVLSLGCGVTGAFIGRKKDATQMGFAAGALLGPIGCFAAMVLMDQRPICSRCKGHVNKDGLICPTCLAPLASIDVV